MFTHRNESEKKTQSIYFNSVYHITKISYQHHGWFPFIHVPNLLWERFLTFRSEKGERGKILQSYAKDNHLSTFSKKKKRSCIQCYSILSMKGKDYIHKKYVESNTSPTPMCITWGVKASPAELLIHSPAASNLIFRNYNKTNRIFCELQTPIVR